MHGIPLPVLEEVSPRRRAKKQSRSPLISVTDRLVILPAYVPRNLPLGCLVPVLVLFRRARVQVVRIFMKTSNGHLFSTANTAKYPFRVAGCACFLRRLASVVHKRVVEPESKQQEHTHQNSSLPANYETTGRAVSSDGVTNVCSILDGHRQRYRFKR